MLVRCFELVLSLYVCVIVLYVDEAENFAVSMKFKNIWWCICAFWQHLNMKVDLSYDILMEGIKIYLSRPILTIS